MYNMTVDKLNKLLGKLEGIKGDLEVKKAIEFLVENSKTVEAARLNRFVIYT